MSDVFTQFCQQTLRSVYILKPVYLIKLPSITSAVVASGQDQKYEVQ